MHEFIDDFYLYYINFGHNYYYLEYASKFMNINQYIYKYIYIYIN